ncbi:MAG: hypothetical protein PHU06_13950, partial [Gallionella sp.]|nr:hypothetical protein [Gallionella sp.]MDD4960152.1 hypothetical protein [Gallionella sp.]
MPQKQGVTDYPYACTWQAPNDAVEKPDSEDLFQRWVDFFQTRSLFSFSASCFYNIFSLQT